MRKWLIYTIWSCETLGSLQINIAYPPPTNQPVSTTAWNIKACRTVVPNLFDLATPFEILHARSTPATIYNCKDVRITTDKIRNTIVSRDGFTVFAFLCKTKQHVCYNQWDDWACICTTSLETLGCMLVRTNLMSFSTSSLFVDFCFNADKGWKSSIKDRGGY